MGQVHTQVSAGQTTKQLYNGAGRVLWHSFIETTGSASAEYRIYDGQDTTGPLILDVSLSSGESTRDWFTKPGLKFHGGLWIDVVSGSVRGDITILPEEECGHWDVPELVVNIPFDELLSVLNGVQQP